MPKWDGTNYTPRLTAPAQDDGILVRDDDASQVKEMLLAYLSGKHLSGTTFPTANLWDGMPFHRTDIGAGLDCFYDLTNTQWLSRPFHISGNIFDASTSNFYFRIPNNGYAVYLPAKNIDFTTYVYTTNDGSNYYTITANFTDNTFGNPTTVHTFNTSADSANTWTAHDDVPDSNTPTNCDGFRILYPQTGSPGNIIIAWGLVYQLIIT